MAEVIETPTPISPNISVQSIPQSLVYEVLNGQILYYKGYKDVLSNQKTLEAIMGSSSLQAILVAYFNRILFKNLEEDLYFILSSEAGVHIDHQNNLANDIAIYETHILTPDKINTQYATVPPKIVIEIDVKADLSDLKGYEYVQEKTKKLLEFGTEKVIWVFSRTQMVLVATPHQNWENMDWNKDVMLMNEIVFNVGNYLKKKGIDV